MTKIRIPTSLRPHCDGQRIVEIDGDDVGSALIAATKKYPNLNSYLFDDDGALVSFINVFVNDENIRDRDGVSTKLADRDEILLVPAMAGG